jgi:hypothetical protein
MPATRCARTMFNPDISHYVLRAAALTPDIDCDGGCGVAEGLLDHVLAPGES